MRKLMKGNGISSHERVLTYQMRIRAEFSRLIDYNGEAIGHWIRNVLIWYQI